MTTLLSCGEAVVRSLVGITIEKHPDGYVAYPIDVVGAIVGQGDTYEEALSDVKSAIACYVEVFGIDSWATCILWQNPIP